MGIFHGALKYERLTSKWVRLEEDISFQFTLGGVLQGCDDELRKICALTGLDENATIVVTAPRGFVTDLASIPKLLRWIFRPDGPYAPAATIHDIIYQALKEHYPVLGIRNALELLNAHHTQLLADRIFLYAMRALNISYLNRTMFYNAVRAFGKSSYGGTPMVEDYGIDSLYRSTPRLEAYPIFRDNVMSGMDDGKDVLHTTAYTHHAVKYPNLKRSFVYPTMS